MPGFPISAARSIARINRNNILLDLSHAGQRTQAEGIAASTAPPAITHSGCRALIDHPRNTYDAEMRALAEKGGVFGIYLMPFIRAQGQPVQEDLLRHLDHAVNVCGEDHVGIGTDNPFLGYEINDETQAAPPRGYRGTGAARDRGAGRGSRGDALLSKAIMAATATTGSPPTCRRRGWSAARIDKVLGDNFVRLFGEVWRG